RSGRIGRRATGQDHVQPQRPAEHRLRRPDLRRGDLHAVSERAGPDGLRMEGVLLYGVTPSPATPFAVRRGTRPVKIQCAASPITSPQKAPPIPSRVMFAAAARKVIRAASRDVVSATAPARLP